MNLFNQWERMGRSRTVRGVASTAAALLVLALGGCASTDLARVGGQGISQREFLEAVEHRPEGAQVLNFMLIETVVDQEAKAKGVLPTQQQVEKALADKAASNPQMAAAIKQNRIEATRQIGTFLAIQNLMKQGSDLTPDKKQKWFEEHRSLFDAPAKVSVVMLFFDDMDRAVKGKKMLQSGSSPTDVAAALGSKNTGINGTPSPMMSKDEMLQVYAQYGPELSKAVNAFFQPGVKTGYTTDPIKTNSPMGGASGNKVAVVQLASVTPAKKASLDQDSDQVEQDMAVEQYTKTHYHYDVPAGTPAQNYQMLAFNITQEIIKELMHNYVKDDKIHVTNQQMWDQIKPQWEAAPTAAGMPGVPGMPGAGGMPVPATMPGAGGARMAPPVPAPAPMPQR